MRVAVLATPLVLGLGVGACGRGAAGRADARPTDARANSATRPSARDARPRADVTQAGRPAPPQDTATLARPHSVPALVSARTVMEEGAVVADGGDTPPQMRNARLPFRYPGALYPRRVQGNVTLRLWVDAAGRVRPESTRVAESSGARLLDSAAVAGSAHLEFTPAQRGGQPAAAPLLFPVHFRHPAGGPPAPGVAGRHR